MTDEYQIEVTVGRDSEQVVPDIDVTKIMTLKDGRIHFHFRTDADGNLLPWVLTMAQATKLAKRSLQLVQRASEGK